jgi:proteasome accessory factor B
VATKANEKWQPAKSDKSERLLQLTCALLFAERGLTKAELFGAIPGYIDAIKSGTSDESLNRMFERDKTDLRSTGIRIYTPNPNADGEEICYLIADDTFVWPKQMELTAKQLQLLELASQVWSQASLQSDASQALVRLRALGVEQAADDLIGFAPRIKTHEPSFLPLTHAIEDQIEVEFSYRKASGEISKRHVQPWSVHNIDGQWLLQSFDLQKKAVRNFLLRRIVSKIQITRIAEVEVNFELPSQDEIDEAKRSLEQHISNQVCELKVKKDTSAWFYFHLDDDPSATDGVIRFNYMDLSLLAEELRDYAADIRVIAPKQLADTMRSGFEKVVSDHA